MVTVWSPGFNSPTSLTVTSNQVAEIKTLLFSPVRTTSGGVGLARAVIRSGDVGIPVYPGWITNGPCCFLRGPATIEIEGGNDAYGNLPAMATVDIQPGPFPPGRTVTVGAYSGNVRVTMEMSTDLVNWTPAVNAALYTNSPDARFFRIQLVTNASP